MSENFYRNKIRGTDGDSDTDENTGNWIIDPYGDSYKAWGTTQAATQKPCFTVYTNHNWFPHVVHESQFQRFGPLPDKELMGIFTATVIFALRGRHLHRLPLDWAHGHASVIVEYDADRWQLPTGDAPVITSIDVIDAVADSVRQWETGS